MVFENVEKTLEKAAKAMGLSEKEQTLMLSHKKISHAVLKVKGKEYPAWRIIHNNTLGPGKGGIRYHPDVSEDEVMSLSFWMSIKNSLTGLPFGGAKGGIKVNPKDLSSDEIQELSREFVRAFHDHMGVDKDVPAPDVYTNPQIMAWMLDEFEKIKGRHEPGFITGKPLELSGCNIRADSTSKGGLVVFNEMEEHFGLKDVTIAVQGFGNAGWHMARLLHAAGYKVVAVSDSRGGTYNKDGLDIPLVKKTKESNGTVSSCKEGEKITNQDILKLDVDILFLAALENQITKDNAKDVKAKYLVELANGPVTADADEILHTMGVTIIPDILANAGGVVGSYFEWIQNKSGHVFEEEFIRKRFNDIMIKAFHKVYVQYKKSNVDMRTAAYMLSIERIIAAEKTRGNI